MDWKTRTFDWLNTSNEALTELISQLNITLSEVTITQIWNEQNLSNTTPIIIIAQCNKQNVYYYYNWSEYVPIMNDNTEAILFMSEGTLYFSYPHLHINSPVNTANICDSKYLEVSENIFFNLETWKVFTWITKWNSVLPILLDWQTFIHSPSVFNIDSEKSTFITKLKQSSPTFSLKESEWVLTLSSKKTTSPRSTNPALDRYENSFDLIIIVDDNWVLQLRAVTEKWLCAYIKPTQSATAPIPQTSSLQDQYNLWKRWETALAIFFPWTSIYLEHNDTKLVHSNTTVDWYITPTFYHTDYDGTWTSHQWDAKRLLEINNQFFFNVTSPLSDNLHISHCDDDNALLSYSQLSAPYNSILIPREGISVDQWVFTSTKVRFLEVSQENNNSLIEWKYVIVAGEDSNFYYKITSNGIIPIRDHSVQNTLDSIQAPDITSTINASAAEVGNVL